MTPTSPGRLTWQQPGCLPTIGRLTMSTISDMAISASHPELGPGRHRAACQRRIRMDT